MALLQRCLLIRSGRRTNRERKRRIGREAAFRSRSHSNFVLAQRSSLKARASNNGNRMTVRKRIVSNSNCPVGNVEVEPGNDLQLECRRNRSDFIRTSRNHNRKSSCWSLFRRLDRELSRVSRCRLMCKFRCRTRRQPAATSTAPPCATSIAVELADTDATYCRPFVGESQAVPTKKTASAPNRQIATLLEYDISTDVCSHSMNRPSRRRVTRAGDVSVYRRVLMFEPRTDPHEAHPAPVAGTLRACLLRKLRHVG